MGSNLTQRDVRSALLAIQSVMSFLEHGKTHIPRIGVAWFIVPCTWGTEISRLTQGRGYCCSNALRRAAWCR